MPALNSINKLEGKIIFLLFFVYASQTIVNVELPYHPMEHVQSFLPKTIFNIAQHRIQFD